MLLATLSLAAVAPSTAFADQKLSVSPTKQTVTIDAGESRTVDITIGAPEDAITASFFHQDFGFGENYEPVLIPDDAEETTGFSTRGWFSTPQPRYRVAAGGSVTVPVKITVPENIPAGTYIGTATFAVEPEGEPDGGQVQTRTGIAAVIFVGVNGGAPPKPRVQRFDVARMTSGGRLEPQIVVENGGSLPFTVAGTVRVDGREPDADSTIPTQYVVPDRPRKLHTGSDNSGRVRIDTKGLGIGRHEVVARLRIDPTNDTLVVRRTFWLVPIWLRVLVGVAALTLVLLASWLVIRVRRWRASRGGDTFVEDADDGSHGGDAFVEHVDDDVSHDDYVDDSSDVDEWSTEDPPAY